MLALSLLGRRGASHARHQAWSTLRLSTLLLASLSTLPSPSVGQSFQPRAIETLSSDGLSSIVAVQDPGKSVNVSDPTSHLSHILIPRPPSSENITTVRKYIVSTLEKLNWHIEEDHFQDNTPYGVKDFTNIIATRDPKASKRVVLSAHYDSKFFPKAPDNQFVGATDSAAPCAMMLDVAEVLGPLLDARQHRYETGEEDEDENAAGDTTLQLVFFDGEEAFQMWTSTDSTYGSRHLAQKWETTYVPPDSRRRLPTSANLLSTIDHLILLDLLGAERPLIMSYFPATGWLFDAFISAEHRLGNIGAFNEPNAAVWNTQASFFVPRSKFSLHGGYGQIEDDHIPFLHRGVNILHVIASPFPKVWHTLADDASALDLPTMKRWNLILRVALAEYLGLRPGLNTGSATSGSPKPEAESNHAELSLPPSLILSLSLCTLNLLLMSTLSG